MSEKTDIIPVFQDEVHFQAQTSVTRTWAQKGSEPKVMSNPGKNNIAYSGFVILASGTLFRSAGGHAELRSDKSQLRNRALRAQFLRTCIISPAEPWKL